MCAIEYYTYEDYKKWKGDWELIYGQPVAMAPSPVISHQYLVNMFAFELTKSTAKRDEKIKFEIYEKELVKYYILVYPDRLTAKIYKNENYQFKKIGDFSKETVNLTENLTCEAEIDFENVFKKLRRKK